MASQIIASTGNDSTKYLIAAVVAAGLYYKHEQNKKELLALQFELEDRRRMSHAYAPTPETPENVQVSSAHLHSGQSVSFDQDGDNRTKKKKRVSFGPGDPRAQNNQQPMSDMEHQQSIASAPSTNAAESMSYAQSDVMDSFFADDIQSKTR